MNKNVKKMIVMLGIVLGSTAMAITVQLGVWGWVPIELYTEYRDECNSIQFMVLIGMKMKWDLPMVFCLFMESVPVLRGI